MADLVVHAANLNKNYRNGGQASPVLRGINLSVSRGECIYLVGPSGSGKTTLLSILGCVLAADGGRLTILGADVLGLSPYDQARFRREQIGFVFQRFHLFSALTALENVCVPLSLLGWPKARSRTKALELLELVGLHDKALPMHSRRAFKRASSQMVLSKARVARSRCGLRYPAGSRRYTCAKAVA